MPRRYGPMPKAMQIFLFKKRFGVTDLVDWEAIVDDRLTFPENLSNLKENHLEEIEKAQVQTRCKTESEKKVELFNIEWAENLENAWEFVRAREVDPIEVCIVSVEVYKICFERIFDFLPRYVHQHIVRLIQFCMSRKFEQSTHHSLQISFRVSSFS